MQVGKGFEASNVSQVFQALTSDTSMGPLVQEPKDVNAAIDLCARQHSAPPARNLFALLSSELAGGWGGKVRWDTTLDSVTTDQNRGGEMTRRSLFSHTATTIRGVTLAPMGAAGGVQGPPLATGRDLVWRVAAC